VKGLIPLCRGLLEDEELKSEREYWEPRIKLKEGKTIEEIVQEHEKDNDRRFGRVSSD
jgi:hypothetical protein